MTISICDSKNIFGLNIAHFHPSWWNAFALLLPFTNELAHLLDRNVFLPYFGLHSYPHHDNTMKMLINFLVFLGISMNVAYKTELTNKYMGTFTGAIYTTCAYILPSLFFNRIVNLVKHPLLRLLIGIICIYILEFLATAGICFIQSWINPYFKKKE